MEAPPQVEAPQLCGESAPHLLTPSFQSCLFCFKMTSQLSIFVNAIPRHRYQTLAIVHTVFLLTDTLPFVSFGQPEGFRL